MRTSLILAAAAAMAACGAVSAQAQPMSMPNSPARYVMMAGQDDLFEIREGKLASERSQTDAIKTFGGDMVRDHSKSTQEVLDAAKASGLPPMAAPMLSQRQRRMYDELAALKGPAFDREYVRQQTKAHEEALAMQTYYAQNGRDRKLKATASMIVPVVQQHLDGLKAMKGL